MATQPNESHQSRIFFTSAAEDEETFKVIRFAGEESISTPYHFEIDLASDNPDVDIQRMLSMPARLTIERGGDPRHVHGVLKTFRQGNEGRTGHYFYHAVLVPRLWLMTLSRQNQIYQDQTVPDIVKAELLATQSKGASVGMDGSDFEFRLTRNYGRREYVVQYAESDFNFISRLMEHEGIFYYFEQDGKKEKLIITDNNIHLQAIAGTARLAYRQASGLSTNAEAAVQDFTCRRRQIPGRIVLKDYNYRLPHLPLQAEADVDAASHGLVSSYGDHFKVPEEGQALATVRSEEIRARQTVYRGQADGIHFSAGGKFSIEEHFRGSFNREYILTAVHHEGHQTLSGIADQSAGESPENDYRNRFEAIAADVAFRPPRVTPKPRLTGIMNAHVDAGLLEDRAEIDDQGRYKVVMPFDLSGQAGGKATRFIRMAQPYGGHSQGMHFPLRKNTEVIWTCIDGDPDRPIIIGAVPNPMTPSVVNSDNHTRNIVKTAHGSFLEFNDGRGNGTPLGQASLQQQQLQRSAPPPADTDSPPAVQTADHRSPVPASGPTKMDSGWIGNREGTGKLTPQQQFQSDSDTYSESDAGDGHDVWFRVNVPDYDTDRDSYLRMGKSPKPEEEKAYDILQPLLGDPEDENEKRPDGWLDYTDGDHTSITMGDRRVLTNGNRHEVVNGTYNLSIAEGGMDVYDAQVFYNVGWHELGGTWVKYESQYLSELTFTAGTNWGLFMGSKIDANIAASLDLNAGIEASLGAVMKYENVYGPVINVASESETKANTHILMRVDPDEQIEGKYWYETLKLIPFIGGVAATAALATGFAEGATALNWNNDAGRSSAAVGAALGALGSAALAYAINAKLKSIKDEKIGKFRHSTMIKMDKTVIEIDNQASEAKNERIELKCGDSSIVMKADGFIEITAKELQLNGDKMISINSGANGTTTISGKEVVAHSSKRTTIGSTTQTRVEANTGVEIGGPDTQTAKIKQRRLAVEKRHRKKPNIRDEKAKASPSS